MSQSSLPRDEGVRLEGELLLADSVTRISTAADRVVVTGSHGGTFAAGLVAAVAAGGAIFNDASIGLDGAGVAGLGLLEGIGVPAAAVSHLSATIGDAEATLAGVISTVNTHAAALGCTIGMSAREAAGVFARAGARPCRYVPAQRETRTHVLTTADGTEVWALDSVSLVTDADADCVLITGSHGALLGGRPQTALKKPAFAAVYNDAGGGPGDRGRTRLPALDARGIPAATVAAATARIGDGLSTFHDGVISAVNDTARGMGGRVGEPTQRFVEAICSFKTRTQQ